jgi:aspartyl-tRNA(Asn)/glutamyl-tRNA(Gln) amidotransferase subunit A
MFSFQSIADYHEQLKVQSTSCTEAVSYYLQRIEQQKNLNAFVDVYAEGAIEKAKILDKKRLAGEPMKALHGVVIASKILEGFESIYSATAIEKLEAADAIIIGNCNCDEFAMGSSNENSYYGPVLNALDNSKVPGGSSGGSAVAVQAGLCMVSLGSDTGGSVRQPADFCGIIGLKPTYGRISRYGLIAYASSFDQIGIFSLTIPDTSLVLQTISGSDDFDSTALKTSLTISAENNKLEEKKYCICYFKEALDHPSLDEQIKKQILSFIEELKALGHRVEAIDFDLLEYIVPAYYVLTTAEASSNLSRYDGVRFGFQNKENAKNLTAFYSNTRSKGFGKEVQRRIMLGTFVLSTGYYDAYFSKAQQVRRLLIDRTTLLFNEFDAIIMPTVPTTAFPIGEKSNDPIAMYLADIYTVFANLTGIPAISIPLFKHGNGLPFGLQIMTAPEDELTLLQLSGLLLQQSGR